MTDQVVSPFSRRPRKQKAASVRTLKSARAGRAAALTSIETGAEARRYDPAYERETQMELYRAHLQSTVSNRGRPYAQGTIVAYMEAVQILQRFLTANHFPGGFERVGHEEINGCLAAYREANGQGGVVTKQSNLRVFFAWVSDCYDVENAYLHRGRNIYRREDVHPETLDAEFIQAMLDITSGKSYADLRDNLIIRLFLIGPRSCELTALQVSDLDLRTGIVTFRAFKWATDNREVPMPAATRQVASAYLRARAQHKSKPHPLQGPLFLGQKRDSSMTGSGVAQMLKRRAEEAGYDPDTVHPHLFRHTAADHFLDAGGQEGDALHLFGWSDGSRSMLDRYGRAGRQRRAVRHAQEMGFGEVPTRRT